MEQAIAHHEKRQRLKSVAGICAFCLPTLAIIAACCISLLPERAVPIGRPPILVFGAVLMLIPFRSELSNTLQKIVGLYMVGVLVNESSARHFQILFLWPNVSISCSTIILLLCMAGYLCGRLGLAEAVGESDGKGLIYGWVLVLAVITLHMILLSVMLNRFYGYGYERNLTVMGNLCLYFLLFITLWERLGREAFRQCVGFILAIFYLAIILSNL